jgi:hypothetical protein
MARPVLPGQVNCYADIIRCYSFVVKCNYQHNLPITAFCDNGVDRGRQRPSNTSLKQAEPDAKYRLLHPSACRCSYVHASPQPWIIYKLSMRRLLCICSSLPQFNFHPTKNSGLPSRRERERERARESVIRNAIGLYTLEVHTSSDLCQGCDDYWC